MPRVQVEILFPLAEVDDVPDQGWFVDGGANQGYGAGPTGGTVAPGALPAQIGTTRLTTIIPTPPPPPPPPAIIPAMAWNALRSNHAWEATNGSNNDVLTPVSGQFDNLGNFIVGSTYVSGTDGSTLYSLNFGQLITAINTWFGSDVATDEGGTTGDGCVMAPVCGGQYIMAWCQGQSPHSPSDDIFQWFALLEPQSSAGTPTVKGAVGYNCFASDAPQGNVLLMSSTGNQGTGDPLIVISSFGIGNDTWNISLLPSPSDITGGTYNGGFSSLGAYGTGGYAYGSCEVPYNFWYPIGTDNLSSNLYSGGFANGPFCLPGSGGGTNLYFYFNTQYTAFCVAGGSNVNPEVQNTIGPSNSGGSIIKIELSTSQIDYASITRTRVSTVEHDGYYLGNSGGATADYSIDNSNWGVPFTDENSYISQSGTLIPYEDTTGGGTLTAATLTSDTITVIGTIYASRTGTIASVEINLNASLSGHIILAIYSYSDGVFSQVGVTSPVASNPAAGNLTLTFGTAVPVTYQTYYYICLLSDGTPVLNGSQMPSNMMLSNSSVCVGFTSAQPYSSGFATIDGVSFNGTIETLPWCRATYTNATRTGSGTGYQPMATTNATGSSVIFSMIDPTNYGWVSLREFSYSGGSASQTSQTTGPVDFLNANRGTPYVGVLSSTPYLFGAQNAYLSTHGAVGQVYKDGIGVIDAVSAKTVQPVTFDGSTSVTLSSPTGLPTDTGTGTLSMWLYISEDVVDTAFMVLSGTNCPINIQYNPSGSNLVVTISNSGGIKSCTWNVFVEGLTGIFLLNGWHHILLCWNTNLTNPYLVVWEDGDADPSFPAGPASTTGGGGPFTIPYSACTEWNFYGPSGEVQGFEGYATELWFAPGVLFDLTNPLEYQNFAGPAGAYALSFAQGGEQPQVNFPANMGTNGQAPLSGMPGSQTPFVYLSQNPGFATNLGYGGSTTASGSLADAPTAPY